MSFVITQGCCNDASCVPVCPVQCIRPRPGDPDFSNTEQLYIDPATCIDCGACMDECPVDAVHPEWELPETLGEYTGINSRYFELNPLSGTSVPNFARRVLPPGFDSLKVAVVGSGPAGCYVVETLSEIMGTTVSLFDRLPTPFGLVRSGVAPDHPKTRLIADRFKRVLSRDNVRCFFNVEVGRDILLQELMETHHAVVWAGGAAADRDLDVPGTALPGAHSARDFVAWYNGHPDFADAEFDLAPNGRAVVIGNGNVALDVARTLLLPRDELRSTDMADHAIEAIGRAATKEVLVVGRRGAEHGAFSLGELVALEHLDSITLTAEPGEVSPTGHPDLKHDVLARAASRSSEGAGRVLRLRFGLEPVSFEGSDKVDSVTFRRSDGSHETVSTTSVFRAVGYRGLPVDGLPFDDATGTIPNDRGRVIASGTGDMHSGVYCSGWIKRGPRGTIGTNRADAQETVDTLLQDLGAGRLAEPSKDATAIVGLIDGRGARLVDKAAWRRIDSTETANGAAESRPRKKLTTTAALLAAALPNR